jgi:glucokinase
MHQNYLGIEIGGTKLQIVVGDKSGQIHERFRFAVNPALGAAGIRQQLEQALPDLASRTKPVAVGVGFGGPVDWKNGRICCSHQIEGWSDFPLSKWLSKLAQAPVIVDNDANVGALGEALCGAGAGFNPVFYVTLGSGVGGGLVGDGKIYHGTSPGEAEIGHIRLDRFGATIESCCSGWAVDAKVRASSLVQSASPSPGGEAKLLSAALSKNHPEAQKILDDTANNLALGLSHVAHLFHPEIIVLGGGLSLIGEPLRSAVETSMRNFIMDAFAPGPKIALAKLGEDAVPVGALQLSSLNP